MVSLPGVIDPNVIDILIEQDGGFAAVMVEARRWGDDPDQLVQLGQKFNTYVNFIVDGSFAAQVPESAGKDVKIQLVCAERPTPHVVEFLNIINSKLSEHDVSLVVQVDESLQIVTDLDRLSSDGSVSMSAFERSNADDAD